MTKDGTTDQRDWIVTLAFPEDRPLGQVWRIAEEFAAQTRATLCTSTDPNDHQGSTCPIHEEV